MTSEADAVEFEQENVRRGLPISVRENMSRLVHSRVLVRSLGMKDRGRIASKADEPVQVRPLL